MSTEKMSRTSTPETDQTPAKFSGKSSEELSVLDRKYSFHQSWLPGEEMQLLNDVLEIVRKGSDTVYSSRSPFDYFKGSWRAKFSKEQLVGKLKSLKRKYENHASRIQDAEEGELIEFESSHERVLYEASSKIWGENGKKNDLGSVLRNEQGAENGLEDVEEGEVGYEFEEDNFSDFGKRYPNLVEELSGFSRCNHCFGCDLDKGLRLNNHFSYWVELFAEGFECLERWELEKLNEQWQLQQRKEFEVFSKRVDLFEKQGKFITEAIKSSKH